MSEAIVITGIGMVTPLGDHPPTILQRIREGATAAAPPARFNAAAFGCPVCAEVKDFKPERYLSETKLIRLMNRDAQLAVAAARLALADAGLAVGRDCAPEDMALYGATGVVGLPLGEVVPLMKASAAADGRFDPGCFGREGLRAVSPILSFKILSNMPLCFVSICENIQGVNGIYTPWEGQGAQAVEAGIRALRCGDARCALVGGGDVKTHEWALLNLAQQGLFESWQKTGAGLVPGEGAAFLVLEREANATARGARTYARIADYALRTQCQGWPRSETCIEVLESLNLPQREIRTVVGSGNHDETTEREQASVLRSVSCTAHQPGRDALPRVQADRPVLRGSIAEGGQVGPAAAFTAVSETSVLPNAGEASPSPPRSGGEGRGEEARLSSRDQATALPTPSSWGEGDRKSPPAIVIHPKRHLGDLFAAAGLVQIGLAALLAHQETRTAESAGSPAAGFSLRTQRSATPAAAASPHRGGAVLATCFGFGSEQAAFLLEKP